MRRSHAGFTIIELIIAILVGSILTRIALTRISSGQGRVAVRGAQTTYAAMHARAIQYSSCSVRRAILNSASLSRARLLNERSWIDLSAVLN